MRLTDSGRKQFAKMARAHEGWIADLMGGLSQADTAALLKLLQKLKAGSRVAIAETR